MSATKLLDRAPLIETLKLSSVSIIPSDGTPLRVVTHIVLATFHLASATGNQNDAVFEHLTLPALRSLSVGLHHPTKSWPRPSNTAFIRRSGCTLTERGFRGCPVHDKRLLEILSAQTALVTFKLNLFNDSDITGSDMRIPMSIVSILSTKTKGGEGLPLPALTVLRLAVLPRHLTDVKRLIQLRSADVAKKDRVARLG